MQHTNALEKSVGQGTSYISCFKGVDLRRTEIAMGAWICQNWCGSSFMGWSTYFLTLAGLQTSNAFTMTIGQYALGAVGTIVSWFLMTYIGRRKLYISGLSIQTVILIIIGGLGFASRDSMSASWAIGALLLVYTAVYDATVGPVCYAIVAEVSSTRLRAKTIVLARIVYNIAGIINFIKMPYFLNADERESRSIYLVPRFEDFGFSNFTASIVIFTPHALPSPLQALPSAADLGSRLGRQGRPVLGWSLRSLHGLDILQTAGNERTK
jgi:SP family general alpha glucoside:H+ symporter-like MFS transporter